MQGWILRRCLTFTKNRLVNRPNKPRDPILRKFVEDLGYFWDDADEEEGEEDEEDGEKDSDVEEEWEEGDAEHQEGEEEKVGEDDECLVDAVHDKPVGEEGSDEGALGNVDAKEDHKTATAPVSDPQPASNPKPAQAVPVASPELSAADVHSPAVLTPEPRTACVPEWTPSPVEVPWPQGWFSLDFSINSLDTYIYIYN